MERNAGRLSNKAALIVGLLWLPGMLFSAYAAPLPATLAGGDRHSLYVRADGGLWAFGSGVQGQLGDGIQATRLVPARVGLKYAQVAASAEHSLGIKTDGTLWAWGVNTYGQLGDASYTNRLKPVLVGKDYAQVATAAFHTLAVKTDGTLWAWGSNGNGQLGTGNNFQTNKPIQVGTGYAHVAVSSTSTVAVKQDGTLWTWGDNSLGQIGDPTSSNRNTPLKIAEGFSQVAAGLNHIVALKVDGTLWAWGDNRSGQLGDGTTTQRRAPVMIGSDYAHVAAGADHTVAVATDGTLSTWGSNTWLQLGDATVAMSNTPLVIGTGYSTAGAGATHTLALKLDGTLQAWGRANSGQLGIGQPATTSQATGTPVFPTQLTLEGIGFYDFASVMVGESATTTLLFSNNDILPGTVTDISTSPPFSVSSDCPAILEPGKQCLLTLTFSPKAEHAGLTTSKIATGELSITSTATLDGMPFTLTGIALPKPLPDTFTNTSDVRRNVLVTSGYIAPAITQTSPIIISNGSYAINDGPFVTTAGSLKVGDYVQVRHTSGDKLGAVVTSTLTIGEALTLSFASTTATTLATEPPPTRFQPRLSGGDAFSLFIRPGGSLWAFGDGLEGQIGDGGKLSRNTPVRIGEGFTQVTAGARHGAAIKLDSSLWVWGSNTFGALGDGTNTQRNTPISIGKGYAQVAASQYHTVAIKTDGSLWAWGGNGNGQLGNGKTTQTNVPAQIGTDYAQVTAGNTFTAAVKSDGSLWAWGDNASGQVGDGTGVPRTKPTQIGTGYSLVVAGLAHTLALKTDGSLWAWGDNRQGQLGDGTKTIRFMPVKIGTGFTQIAAGAVHSVALKEDGSLWAWGSNPHYQLGNTTSVVVTSPVQIGTGFTAIAAGANHTLAIKLDGSLVAWGMADSGQLGVGKPDAARKVTATPIFPPLITLTGEGFHDFGSVKVGETAKTELTLTNTDKVATTLARFSATLPFGVSSDCPATLAAGASCKVSLTFTPISVDASRTGKLNSHSVQIDSGASIIGAPIAVTGTGLSKALASQFTDVVGVQTNVQVASFIIDPAITEAQPISIADGVYAINEGVFTNTAGTLKPGDSLQLMHTATGAAGSNTTTTATLGSRKLTFRSTTVATPFLINESPISGGATTVIAANGNLTVNFDLPPTPKLGTVNVYLIVLVPQGTLGLPSPMLFVKNTQRNWEPLTLPISAHVEGVVLGAEASRVPLEVFADFDFKLLSGVEVYVAYGNSDLEMLSASRYKAVFRVP